VPLIGPTSDTSGCPPAENASRWASPRRGPCAALLEFLANLSASIGARPAPSTHPGGIRDSGKLGSSPPLGPLTSGLLAVRCMVIIPRRTRLERYVAVSIWNSCNPGRKDRSSPTWGGFSSPNLLGGHHRPAVPKCRPVAVSAALRRFGRSRPDPLTMPRSVSLTCPGIAWTLLKSRSRASVP